MTLDTVLIWLTAGVCGHDPAHSFFIAGRQLPLCARDLGLFGGFLAATLVLNAAGRCPRRRLWWLLAVLPLLGDGINSVADQWTHLGLYQPSNSLRLATGLIAGLGLALLAAPRLRFPFSWLPALALPLAGLNAYAAASLFSVLGVLVFAAAGLRLGWLALLPGRSLPAWSVMPSALALLLALSLLAHAGVAFAGS